MRLAAVLLAVALLAASPASADTTRWLHDISVRVSLTSRLRDGLQEFPWATRQAMPEYPARWRAEGVTGEARLRFTVSATGELSQLRVVAASQKEFGEAALAAVKTWTYRHGLDRDRKTPIVQELEYLFVFELHEPVK